MLKPAFRKHSDSELERFFIQEETEIEAMKKMIQDHGFCDVGRNGVKDEWPLSEIIDEFQMPGLFKALSDLHRADDMPNTMAAVKKLRNAMNHILDEALPEKAKYVLGA